MSVITRILGFTTAYIAVDASLELAAESSGGPKSWWHHVVATTFSGGLAAVPAGRAPAGILLGAALGAVSAPAYMYAQSMGAPSALTLLRQLGAFNRGDTATPTAASSSATTPAPARGGDNATGEASK